MNQEPAHRAIWNEHDFQAFIKAHAAAFHLFAARYIKDTDTINDILQESFIKLWDIREQIGAIKSLRNYVYSIIKHTIADHWRKTSKERVEDVFRNYAHLADEEAFFRNMVEAESALMVAQAIKALSPQSQKVVLRSMRGEKIKEIAEALHISVNTVKTIKYRAFERLQGLLKNLSLFVILFLGNGRL